MITGLVSFLDRLYTPFLLLFSIPPPQCLPGPDPFSKGEFPPRQFPLSARDWRDLVVFLYVSPLAIGSKTKRKIFKKYGKEKEEEQYKVVEIGRYTFAKPGDGDHQVVIAKVEVAEGLYRLLRIERDSLKGVKDSEDNQTVTLQEDEAHTSGSGSSSDAIQPPAPAAESASKSSHPSMSVYAVDAALVKPGVKVDDDEEKIEAINTPEIDIDIDTVQTISKYDLRVLVQKELVEPKDFYLDHLALLVGEVHDYDCGNGEADEAAWISPGHHTCVIFADLLMRAIEKEMGVISATLEEAAVVLDPIAPSHPAARSKQEAVNAILERYRRARDDVDLRRQIAMARVLGGETPGRHRKPEQAQLRPQTQAASRSRKESIKKEDVEHREDLETTEVER